MKVVATKSGKWSLWHLGPVVDVVEGDVVDTPDGQHFIDQDLALPFDEAFENLEGEEAFDFDHAMTLTKKELVKYASDFGYKLDGRQKLDNVREQLIELL